MSSENTEHYLDSNTRVMRGVDELLERIARDEIFKGLSVAEQTMALEVARAVFFNELMRMMRLDTDAIARAVQRQPYRAS